MYSVDLVDEIGNLITNARKNVVKKVNNELLETYWNIGRVIVEDEHKNERGEYGKKQLISLSKTRANLQNMRLL